MLSIAAQTIRARWTSFAGVFIALSLGVCLLATTGLTIASTAGVHRAPVWYAGADAVVAGPRTAVLHVDEGDGVAYDAVTGTRFAQAVPAEAAARIAAIPGVTAVVDRAVPVDLPGGVPAVAHPWASAGLHRYTMITGTEPSGPGEVVLTAPTGHRPGDRVDVLTPAGPRTWTVAGVVSGPSAVYVTDATAEELAGGRIDAVAVRGLGGRVDLLRVAAGPQARVLTGDDRAGAEDDPDADLLAVAAALLGTTAGVAGFVSVFVVSGTFAFAVAQRRRELALLRAASATPRQVRRLVLGEALIVGVLAGVTGCVLGVLAAPPFAGWLAREGFAPERFTARFILWPLLAAFGAGLLVALAGAAVAARRAGRIRPIEALREASVDRRAMTVVRWLFGLAFLGGAAAMLLAIPGLTADAIALILLDAMLAITGIALLAPVLAPPLAGLLGRCLPGVAGGLARDNARRSVRRTASTVAPILVTVGIAAATLAATATLWRAEEQAGAARVTAGSVVVPTGTAGLGPTAVDELAASPGVEAAVPIAHTVVYLAQDDYAEEFPAIYAGPGVERVMRLPSVAGAVGDLHGTGTLAVGAGLARSMHWTVGGTAELWLDDSARVTLRVVAILAPSLDLDQTVLLPWDLRAAHAPRAGADAVYLAGAPATTAGGRLVPAVEFFAALDAEQRRTNDAALIAVLGMALLYTTISIANTLVMATADRVRDLALLRLTGTTPRQALTMIALEALLVAGTGVLLAGAVTAAMMAGLLAGLRDLVAAVEPVVPWGPVVGIALVCAVVTLAASLGPAWLALRRPATRMAAARE
ncbi:FtsX-like permease family protein [Dactylosporangium sp. NPDC005572]|uniref:FtsX-like permease family protein n=1 Tax=Dactylosporangium sp. NPDC005572 TaxID=3156889 RepID=UPI0033BD6FB5